MNYMFQPSKLTNPTHSDRFLIRMGGGAFYIAFGMDAPTFDDAKPSETCDFHTFLNMSPQLAKILRDKLMFMVAQYEAQYGEIRLPTPPVPPAAPPVTGGGGGGWQAGGSGGLN